MNNPASSPLTVAGEGLVGGLQERDTRGPCLLGLGAGCAGFIAQAAVCWRAV